MIIQFANREEEIDCLRDDQSENAKNTHANLGLDENDASIVHPRGTITHQTKKGEERDNDESNEKL